MASARALLLYCVAIFFIACSGEHEDTLHQATDHERAVDGGASHVGFDASVVAPDADASAPTGTTDAASGMATLTVVVAGDGTGHVGSAPAGIDCGTHCTASFAAGTLVKLTPVVSEGSAVQGWAGPCEAGGASGECTVRLDADATVTARFALARYPLRVSYGGDGSGTVHVDATPAQSCTSEPCSYTHGTLLALTATPAADSHFLGWNGVDCSKSPICMVTMTSALDVEALFSRDDVALSVVLAGAGAGTVVSSPAGLSCPSACLGAFPSGSSVDLTAQADASSSRFVSWSAPCADSSRPCRVTVGQVASVTATFALLDRLLTLSTTGTGVGTVVATKQGEDTAIIECGNDGKDCEEPLSHGTVVELVATPADGSSFTWGGACAGETSNTCTVSMDAARNVSVDFALVPRTLTLTFAGNGSGSVVGVTSTGRQVLSCAVGAGPCTATVPHGTSLTLTATPSSSRITWGNACSGTQSTCALSMTQDRAAALMFTRVATLTVVVQGQDAGPGPGEGRVTSSPSGIDCGNFAPTGTCTLTVDAGTSVTLTATPHSVCAGEGLVGDSFSSWSSCSVAGPCAITLDNSTTVTATFVRQVCIF